jgi:RNA polymerase sigma factor (sigma-70 family)
VRRCVRGCSGSSRTRRGTAVAPRDGARVPSGDAAPSPEGEAVIADERSGLLAALERLPEEQRLTVGLRYLLDLSEEETAAALGIRRGTVKSRLARALERLREVYAGV